MTTPATGDLPTEDTVCGVLQALAARAPGRPAIVLESGVVSYGELDRGVERVANWLKDAGLQAGDWVGISIAAEFDHLIVSLALLRLGCGQVTLATFDPEAMRQETARRIGVSAVVAQEDGFALPMAPVVLPDVGRLFADAGAAPSTRLPPPDPDAAALVLTSSGTTGRPKLIPLSHRQIVARSRCTGLVAGERTIYRPSPIEFAPSKRQLLFALCLGNRCVVAPRPSNAGLMRLCDELDVGHLSLTVPQARALAEAAAVLGGRPALPAGLHLVLVGAAAPPDLRALIERRLTGKLHVAYGATEYGMIAISGPGDHGAHANCVGRPLAGVDLEIVDGDGNSLPDGRAGEIRVRGPGMARGYLDDPDQTERAFRGGWYHTGDIGVRLPDGRLTVDGRTDEMMNMNSVNIFPLEIEAVIEAYPGVLECAAFPLASPVHGDIPMAAVKVADGVDLAALRRHCRDRLGIRSPRRLIAVTDLPRNAAGKVLRGELATRYLAQQDAP